ncbi:MAG: hypothetical protein ACRD0U_01105 [Acidimicrobiales bacterium]
MPTTEDRRYIEEATRQFKSALTSVIEAHHRSGRKPRTVLGDPESFAQRAVRATAPLASPWDDLVGPFTRSEGVQQRLGISRQAVAAKASRRRLLRVVTSDGDHLYPVWQFVDGGLIQGLPELLAMFPEAGVDGWTLAGWLRTPDPELVEPPIEALRRGEVERVHTVGRSAARSLAG